MSDPFIYINGRIYPSDAASVPPQDRGLLYGDGLFETLRIYGGVPFRLHAHWKRLCEAATVLRISLPLTYEDMDTAVQQVLTANARTEGAMRITITRGSGHAGLDPHPEATPTVLITTAPRRSTLNVPCRLVTVSVRRDETSALSRIKSLNYLPNILARFEVKDKNADEGLLLNTQGTVTEGTVSNIFWIKGQILFTPSVDCGVLPGITRAAVMEVAEETGLLVAEGAFDPAAPRNADAVFLTNALIEIAPVRSLDDHIFDERGSEAIERVWKAYRQLVTIETGIESI